MSETIIRRNGSIQNSGSITVETGNTTGNNFKIESHISGTSRSTLNDGSSNEFITGADSRIVINDQFSEVRGGQNQYVGGSKVTVVQGDTYFRFGNLNPTPYATEKAVLKGIDEYKSLFEIKRTNGGGVFNSMEQSESGEYEPCRACSQNIERNTYDNNSGNSLTDQLISLIPIDLSIIGFLGFKLPGLKLKSIPILQEQYPQTSECEECKGTGLSPSSEKGNFEIEEKKEEIGKMYEESAPTLANAEQNMGEGGNFTTEVSKNMVISVGTVFNDLNSVRTDPKGKLVQSGFDIDKKGMYPIEEASPLVEPKHVDDLAGGTLTVIANNKAAFIVGAGGLKIQTAGINEISGTITNITGEQVNISSSNEVNLGGSRLNITSKALSLKPSGGQLVVDSNLAVKSNLMVQGGAMITGPLFCNGITGPLSYQKTEELLESYATTNDKIQKIIGYLIKEIEFEVEIVSDSLIPCVYALDEDPNVGKMKRGGRFVIRPVADVELKSMTAEGLIPDPESVRIYPHSHVFRNINLTLDGKQENIHSMAKPLTENVPMEQPPIKHGLTGSDKDKETSVNIESDYNANYTATTTTGSIRDRTVYVDFEDL